MYQIKEEGYTFDAGPTLVMTPDLYNEVFEICDKNPQDYIPMKKLNPMMGVEYADDTSFEMSNDLVELIQAMEAITEKDTAGLLKYSADI